nr:signal peptidase II [Planctomycetota bacterium]
APRRTDLAYLARWFAVPLGLTLVVDLITKGVIFRFQTVAAAQAYFGQHPWIRPHINTGAAWSMGGDHPGLIAALTVALIPILAFTWWRWFRGTSVLEDLAFGCILGGALGNAVDRIHAMLPSGGYGGVRDFIWVDLNMVGINYIWPTFNIADVGISIGFVALVLTSFRSKTPPTDSPSVPST